MNLEQLNNRSTESLPQRPIDDSRKSLKNTRQNSPPRLSSPVLHAPQIRLETQNNHRRFNFSNAHFETHALTHSNQTDYLVTNLDHAPQRREFASGSDRLQHSVKNPDTGVDPPLISRIKPLNLPTETNLDKENADHNIRKLPWQQPVNQRLSIFDVAPKVSHNHQPIQALNFNQVANDDREDESVEELVFSGRTISNLAFDECEDYEFN